MFPAGPGDGRGPSNRVMATAAGPSQSAATFLTPLSQSGGAAVDGASLRAAGPLTAGPAAGGREDSGPGAAAAAAVVLWELGNLESLSSQTLTMRLEACWR